MRSTTYICRTSLEQWYCSSYGATYDKLLALLLAALVCCGLVMVASASLPLADRLGLPLGYFFFKQLSRLALAGGVALIIFRVPVKYFEKISFLALFMSLFLLLLVLVPGISRTINGSQRWLALGPFQFQPSEFVKLGMICYLSGYLVRHARTVTTRLVGFLKPLLILFFFSFLLLLEPDFGTVIVLATITMGMLFIAGVPLKHFGYLSLFGISLLLILAISSPYRVQRLTSFLDPWADQFNTGYQLTQSLIAFGQGQWIGTGLGASVQKWAYLPEAHTDFIFAVLAEECGFSGSSVILGLYLLLALRLFYVSYLFRQQQALFAQYFTFGVGLWLGVQALINIGVATGLLPTKGLTLPLLSYGGTSLLIVLIAVSIVMRLIKELRIFKW